MLNIECTVCGEEGVVDFDESQCVDGNAIIICPHCGAELDLLANEFFYDLNITMEEYERMMENGEI